MMSTSGPHVNIDLELSVVCRKVDNRLSISYDCVQLKLLSKNLGPHQIVV